jgi:hypothetical protein
MMCPRRLARNTDLTLIRLVVYTLGSNSEDPGNYGAIRPAFFNGNSNVMDGIRNGGPPTPIATGFTMDKPPSQINAVAKNPGQRHDVPRDTRKKKGPFNGL